MFKFLHSLALVTTTAAQLTCPGSFNKISAWDFSARLNPGWNTGNTLDAMPTETSWGQQPLVNETFTNAKNRGFKGIRIPVTWADHFIANDANYTVDPAWLRRVYDSWLNPDATGFNRNETLAKFYRFWFQIGTKLGCKSSLLAFETINEPSGNTSKAEDGDFLNNLHANMVKAISDAGGFNKDRVVILCGLSDGYTTATQYLKLPPNMTNPWALTWHMYGPWSFTAAAFGDTIWGSDADNTDMYNNIHWGRTNFTNVPIIIGEFGIGTAMTETAARWKYYDFVVNSAYSSNTSVMLWDASSSFAPNTTQPYGDQTALDIIIHAAKGVHNALANSTENGNDPTYWSSSQLFQKLGSPIQDTNLPFLWNNKSITSISCSDGPCQPILRKGVDYQTNSQNITFTKDFMSSLFPSNAQSGLKANMVFHFDQDAADLRIPAYLWSKPSLAVTNVTITNATAQNDLWVPIKYAGMPQVAMATAQMINNTYLVNSWTQWSGPMIRGAATYGDDWSYNGTHVAVLASDLQQVIAAGVTTVFTFECYPRTGTGDNNAILTITPRE
ncbi:glycoside hydrolase family 5 protein [Hyaloscypha variabilis F]|uniref:Glycoside hydrolase family 5 protein n=1 Tax=Hyaloscypha variabilis (strain UAMH 11265 / GT02V1 / F) TaxID=1149755 RepID=A0A2J6R299_HYAVF|nr:glycoside hydrolase family 5 protein [Hyaloscypha variabilis F]